MDNFDHILKWELKAGSHRFPGPEGGTCINEAAIVAAGFEYKKVNSYADLPPCFCPVLATVAAIVNDNLEDGERQKLLPLVTRLAGSKGNGSAAGRRVGLIMQAIEKWVVALEARELAQLLALREACSVPELYNTLSTISSILRRSPLRIVEWCRVQRGIGIHSPPYFATAAVQRTLTDQDFMQDLMKALFKAADIGPQAPALDMEIVRERVEKAKAMHWNGGPAQLAELEKA